MNWVEMFVMILTGASGTLVIQNALELRRRTKRPPSEQDVRDLLEAIGIWGERYSKANPTGKYLKRREADLAKVVFRVGTMWLKKDGAE